MENIFLSYHFDDDAKLMAAKIGDLIGAHNLKVITGEHAAGQVLTDKIEADIENSDALIFILSKRADGKTNDWVMHEVSTAKILKKPFIGLIEEGVQLPAIFKGREYIKYKDTESSYLWLKLTITLNAWIREKGRPVQAVVEPQNIAKQIQNIDNVKVEYRLTDENYNKTIWKPAKIKKTKGGLSVLLKEVRDKTDIELRIVHGNDTWVSEPVNQNLVINLS